MRHKDPELMQHIRDFVDDCYADEGRFPSTTEIGKAVGVSRGTAYRYLVEMNERGLISYDGSEILTEKIERLRSTQIEKHPEIKFTTHEKTFESRCDAIVWICMNQLGRRNLSSGQKKYLLGKMYEARKTVQGSNNQYVQAKSENYQNDSFHSTDVAAQIAKEQNVGYATVHRAASFAKAVDIADEIEPGIRSDVLSGDFKPTERELREIIRAGPDERPAIVERIRKHTPKDKATPPQRKVSNLEMDLVHQIGNEMLEARSNGNPETMLYEMNDALGSLTFRWNFCYENYRSFFEDDNYREDSI